MTNSLRNHQFTARIYYEDTDTGGIVYHASYLRFAERARTEWLRALDVNQHNLRMDSGIGFVVSKLSIDYLAPARLDDEIAVITDLLDLGRASLRLRQDIWRGPTLLAALQVTVAAVDTHGHVAHLPKSLYNKLQD